MQPVVHEVCGETPINITIERYQEEITPALMELLLDADPDERAVLGYLPGSAVLVARERAAVVGIAVVTEQAGQFELKNIAVSPDQQGRGIAKQLIARAKDVAKEAGASSIDVGTGNSSLSQLALYQKCGFRMVGVETNFFADYPEPIVENGIRCIDKVLLRAPLE